MTPVELLAELARRGVHLHVEGQGLSVRAPRGVLDEELRRELATAKPGLLALLREGAPATAVVPLSHGQSTLWFLDRLEPGNAAYNVSFVARLTAQPALDPAALGAAFTALVARHAALRTVFPALAGQPVARVLAQGRLDLVQEDASDLAWEELAGRLRALAAAPFDLARGPLARLHLFDLGGEHVLLLTVHHIAGDLWSLAVLLDELGRLYPAARRGEALALPPPEASYADSVRWQAESLAGPEGERLWAYWREQLGGELPTLDLPTDRPRPPVRTWRGGALGFRLSAEEAADLKALAARTDGTLYVALLGLFAALLGRHTGQRELVVGSITAGRGRSELSRVVGFFANPVALRLAMAPQDPAGPPDVPARLSSFLGHVRDTVHAALEHEAFPFSLAVERLQPARDLARPPLFQVAFLLEQQTDRRFRGSSLFTLGEEGGRIELGELTLTSLPLPPESAQYELMLMAEEVPEGLAFSLQYNRDLFDGVTAARLAARYRHLIAGALARPDAPVADLPLLGEAEQQQLLREWNDSAEPAGALLLHERLSAWARRRPDAVAAAGEAEHLSFGELDRRARALARHLAGLGVGPEARVGLSTDRSPAFVLGALAILHAGGAFVPLDPGHPPERLARMLAEAGARAVLTVRRLRDRLPAGLTAICLDGGGRRPRTAPARAMAESLAYVIFTSGSTGGAKGVLLTHRGLANLAAAQVRALGLGPHDRVLQFSSPSFDASVWELVSLCEGGAALCFAEPMPLPGPDLAALLAARAVTTMTLTPSVLALLPAAGLPAVRVVVAAGEACPAEVLGRWLAPGRAVFDAYGPTETTVCASLARYGAPGSTPAIGRPLANLRVHLLDGTLRPVPPGAAGELCVGGPSVARGYLGRPELTAERFVPDALSGRSGERLYRTGDLAHLDREGNLQYLGRRDSQVKVRGARVELGEVEAALAEHPGLAAAVVALSGQGAQGRLVAWAVPRRAAVAPTTAELRAFLRRRLPEVMVPSLFSFLDALPLTASGKVDLRALLMPDGDGPDATASAVLPGNDFEARVAAAWRRVLGRERVGRDDSFFDLGGHSLLMPRLQFELEKEVGRAPSVVELFAHPTVRSLAAFLAGGEPTPAPRFTARGSTAGVPGIAPDIAIIGLAGRFPGARDVAAFWQNLAAGRDAVTLERIAESGGGRPAMRAGGVLDGVEEFDAAFFGVSPRDAEQMDPQHRLFLEHAWEALENAGHDPRRFPGAIGVFAGTGVSYYLLSNLMGASPGNLDFGVLLGNDGAFLPTRVSYKLDLRGPSVHVQTACSTSLVAAALACQSLVAGQCDMALAGGISVRLPQLLSPAQRVDGVLAPDGRCRAFDAGAQGTVGGNGAGIVVLRRLADALADGDTVYAVIRGWAINNDGALKAGYTAPSVEGQARAIGDALAMAGLAPDDVSYVEAHGSGTPLGDPIEMAALGRAFGPANRSGRACAVGSVKTSIGHLDSAAGVAGLIKTTLALHHGQIPASLHFAQPNPEIDWSGGRFHVNTQLCDWPREAMPRRAGVSAFGIGGTNAHLVLEEAPAAPAPGASRPWQLLALAARTPVALEEATGRLATRLGQISDTELADAAYTLALGRRAFAHRRFLVCHGRQEAAEALSTQSPERLYSGLAGEAGCGVAFLFPGIGDHYAGMGAGLYAEEPAFRTRIDRCAELLAPGLGLDLRTALYGSGSAAAAGAGGNGGAGLDLRGMLGRRKSAGEDDPLAARARGTAVAHAALFATEYALAGLWRAWGVEPRALLGYSLGELVAATVAGVLPLEGALRLLVERAALLDTLPAGGMLTVALGAAEVAPHLTDDLALAAINGPALTVVAGPAGAVDELARRLAADGIACRRLPTSRALHCPLVEPLREPFRNLVARLGLAAPTIPFVSNLTGTWITAAQATDPDYWAAHLCSTVRFAEGLGELLGQGATALVEAGPGGSLGSFALQRGEDEGAPRVAVPSLPHAYERRPEQAALLESLGRLWLAGVEVDWRAFYAGETRRRIPLPTYPFERRRFWIEPRAAASVAVAAPRAEPAREPAPAVARQADLADWFYAPVWRETPARAAAAPAEEDGERRWLLFTHAGGPGEALAAHLARGGRRVLQVRPGDGFARVSDHAFEVGREPQDYERLLAALHEQGARPDRIVHLWSAAPLAPDPASLEGVLLEEALLEEALEAGFYSLLHLARALGRSTATSPTGGEVQLWVVASGSQDVLPGDPLDPARATLLAPCRIVPQEYTNVVCRAIDVEAGADPSVLAGRLLAELEAPGDDLAVALRGAGRWAQTFEPRPLPPAPARLPRLRDDGVYLITGGLGRIGLALAEYLATAVSRPRLVLLSRSGLPDDAALSRLDPDQRAEAERRSARLRELERQGAEVMVAAADVGDPGGLASIVAAARQRFGTIHGVVHAAGVVGLSVFSPIAETGKEQVELHFRPKVRGLLHLERCLAGLDLDFLVLTSSLSPILGGLGFSAYAAANLYMDAFARRRARQRGDTTSINWADWRHEERGTTGLGATVAALEISPAEGIETFRRILAAPPLPQVVVSSGDLEARLDQWVRLRALRRADAAAVPAGSTSRSRAHLPTPYAPPQGEIERTVAGLWEELLGIEPVGRHDSFFQAGGHSLIGTQLVSRLRAALGVDVPLRLLFEEPTVAGFATALAALGAGPDAGASPSEEPPPALVPDPAGRYLPFGLTDIQEAYWVGRSGDFALGGVASHGYVELDIPGLDLGRFERAWQRVVDRHDMLRAVFLPDARQQVLAQVAPYAIAEIDLSGLAEAARAGEQAALREIMSHHVPAPDRWPLFDLRVTRSHRESCRLHLGFDLLIGDVRSLEVLLVELVRLYREPEAELPPLALTFRDCVLAEESLRGSAAYGRDLDYWRERAAALPPAPELPLAMAPEALARPRFRRRVAHLPAADWRRLLERAGERNLTPSGLLLAAYAEVLARFSREPRFTLNLTLFNRPSLHPEIHQVVGDFTSIVLLAVDATTRHSFAERAQQLQRRLWEDLDHRLVSGVKVLRERARSRAGAGAQRAATMPVVFTSNLVHGGEERSAAIAELGELVYGISQTPQVWLDCQVAEEAGALAVIWDAVEDLFPPGLLDAMFACYRELLAALAGSEGRGVEAWLSAAPVDLPAEQAERRRLYNETALAFPEATLVDLFAAQARQRPSAPAILSRRRALTYADLDGRSRALAWQLAERGVRPGTLVAVVMEKGWEQAVATLAVLRAGAAYLPIDPELPAERLGLLLAQGEVAVAICQPWWEERLAWPAGVSRLVVDDEPAPAPAAGWRTPSPRPEDLAYVIFTSGSTGVPKGVMIDHRGAVNTLLDVNRRFAVGPDDRVLALSSLGFDLSVYDLFGAFAAGAAAVVPEAAARRDPAAWAELAAAEGVTVWNSVPALLELLAEYLEHRQAPLPGSLRLALLSGDWIPLNLPERLRRLSADLTAVSLGGATEGSIWSIFHPIESVDPAWRSIPYGRPLANQTIHVLDEALAPRPEGVAGDLYIGGVGVALGYWRDEARTAASFLLHPTIGERLYRTGDRGRFLIEGCVEFLGRDDAQVKVQGYRVELGEVEAVLARHPRVRVVAAAVQGERGNRRLVAFAVAGGDGPPPEPEELRELARQKLPAYMVPSAVAFLPALPLSANGKVDRAALPELDGGRRPAAAEPGAARSEAARPAAPVSLAADPRPTGGASVVARAAADSAEASAAVARVAALVESVLGLGRIEPDANLVQLGATSVDLIRIANALERDLGFRPRLDGLYAAPSVAGLACAFAEAREPARIAPAAAPALILDPEERQRFKQRQPGLRPANGWAALPLDLPAEDAEALADLARERRSHRQFSPEPLGRAALGGLLSCLRQAEVGGRPKYRYGSAGGLYPVQTYLHLKEGAVAGLPRGAYYYDPAAHKLVLISPGAEVPEEVHSPFVNRPVYAAAAFSVFLVLEREAIVPLYGERAGHYAALEAGLMTQLLETEAPRHGIGLCQIGEIDFAPVRPLLALGDSHELVHSLVGGRVAPEAIEQAVPPEDLSLWLRDAGDDEREEVVI